MAEDNDNIKRELIILSLQNMFTINDFQKIVLIIQHHQKIEHVSCVSFKFDNDNDNFFFVHNVMRVISFL